MSRYRLEPTADQQVSMTEHCRHARFVWNLAVEQQAHWQPGRVSAPGYNAQARQLTEARAAFAWFRAGAQTVQQQALRDFNHAMAKFFNGTHRHPTWRKAGVHEGFRQVGVKPGHVEPPGNEATVGVDRRVSVSVATSDGDLLSCPGLSAGESERLLRLRRALARAKRGSNRRRRVKSAIAKLTSRAADRRKDWVEKTPTCAPGNRESQAVFRCRACGHRDHADVNAASNIAAGRAVTAHGDLQSLDGSVKCEAAENRKEVPIPYTA